ncbi:hypothetical protein M6B38_315570 [Iris pallida]|uniref:Uncharacterized protein n=1 Tax=Iris pallida TaxID=29817 RepID=A0AAX6HFC5_IRIPA|nr:hypothetical protein M6B38_315570 [Iris pallida]
MLEMKLKKQLLRANQRRASDEKHQLALGLTR